MITFDTKYLLVASCESLVPSYVQHLKGTNSDRSQETPLMPCEKNLPVLWKKNFKKMGKPLLS